MTSPLVPLLASLPGGIALFAVGQEWRATRNNFFPVYSAILLSGSAFLALWRAWAGFAGALAAAVLQWALLLGLVQHFDRPKLPANTRWVDGAGRVALITGVNFNGIGYYICRSLLQAGFHVVFADVHGEKHLELVREALLLESGISRRENLEYIHVDLLDWASIRRLVAIFRSRHSRLDVLVNNAGGTVPGMLPTGFSKSWMLNYLAPMALTKALLGMLQEAPAGRVVFTCSSTPNYVLRKQFMLDQVRRSAPEHQEDMLQQYGRAKLCIATFTKELQRQLANLPPGSCALRADCFHPGAVGSNIFSAARPYLGPLYPVFFRTVQLLTRSPEEGAVTGALLAASEGIEAYPAGEWWFNGQPAPHTLDPQHRDPKFGKDLWDYSQDVFEFEYQAGNKQ